MPSLQITDVVPRIQYTAAGGQTNFVIPFVFFALTDPAVYLTPAGDTPSDYDDILIYITDYTVVQNGTYTGTMILNSAAAAGDIITIVRAMPDQRLNYYLPAGAFTADAVNTDFESEVLMIQQNKMYDQTISPHYNLTSDPQLPDMNGGQDIILPVLTANQVWVKDPTNNFITGMDFGAGGAVVTVVTQANHGFIVGNVVYFNGNTVLYEKAQADTSADAEVIGIVNAVTDANTFQLTTSGSVTTLSGLVAGSVYFLSDVSLGALSLTEPTTISHISKPLFIAVSATSGYFTNFRGKVISAPFVPPVPVPFPWTVVTVDTQMVVNNGYVANTAALCELVLPVLAAEGDVVRVGGYGVGGWQVTQNAGQSILFDDISTTVGVGGTLASTNKGDAVELVCVVANTSFTVVSSIGIITVV